jgi:hypothetical protein
MDDFSLIQNCDWKFEFQCPRQWAQLALTDDPLVRTCAACLKDVHFCSSSDEVALHARLGHCVAVAPKEPNAGELMGEVVFVD